MATKHSPLLNLASASVAGVVTLIRPTRFPRWARRSLSLANTAGTAGTVLLAIRGEDELPEDHPLHRAVAISDLTAASTGGLMLLTSGLGLKADAKVERILVRRGVRHPRLVMAAGVVIVLFAVKTVQDAASRRTSGAAEAATSTESKPSISTKPANQSLPSVSGGSAPAQQDVTTAAAEESPNEAQQ
ncbi:hypothetical protein [Flexivirga caeni]|uniref:Uncharacterized protein n=1 Tax=Flexivirga caeni TaxID=2294115 RepID=A0A3M9MIB0_9MICO|nr:hypothetical protein [Flexivirga caeni]RNI25234.1 hypothetical protein EFY87_00920 [Flexivirga caeni]